MLAWVDEHGKHESRDETVRAIHQTWAALEATFGTLKAPNAGFGPDGSAILSWNVRDEHLEIEFTSERAVEFFYLNFTTNACWDADYAGGGFFPARLREALALVGAGA